MPDNEDPRVAAEELCDEAVDVYADGNYDEAIKIYDRALALDPSSTDALTGLAMCHQARGDLESAIKVTRRYTEVAPDDISLSPT